MQSSVNTKYSAHVIHGEYYPHIDGIRALAVLPVVMFHILAALCPGGFTGVDVFFVISGYLITGGILRDLKEGQFTFSKFYYRRIRRIMPAYFALISCVFIFGCSLYYADPLIFLGDAVAASALFLANIHFWMLGGDYFASHIHSQALLHLWSLSVEEQFYLLIPLICVILWRFRQRMVVPILSSFAILSLLGAVYAVMTGRQNIGFYFLHYRAWELLAGSLLATFPTFHKVAGPSTLAAKAENVRYYKNVNARGALERRHAWLSIIGLLMVLFPYAVFSSKTSFPGATVLPSVIGTALLIRYGQSGYLSRLLSWRPVVLTGKMSYSLYLWHWPVIVFWKYAVYDQLSSVDYVGMFFASLVLAYISWKFVEIPGRSSPFWTMRRTFACSATGIILLLVLGSTCVHSGGWSNVLHSQVNSSIAASPLREPFIQARIHAVIKHIRHARGHNDGLRVSEPTIRERDTVLMRGGDGRCSIGASGLPRVFLIGDSHAGSLRYGLDVVLKSKQIAGYTMSCSSTDLFNLRCQETQVALNIMSRMPKGSCVILAQKWLRDGINQSADNNSIWKQLEEFSAQVISREMTLFIVADVPNYHFDFNAMAARVQIITPRRMMAEWMAPQQSEEEYDRMQDNCINRRLETICRETGAVFVPLQMCLKKNSHYIYFGNEDGKNVPLYRDTEHLSQEGSLRAARYILTHHFPDEVEQD